MIVLVCSQISSPKRAGCLVNACGLEYTKHWRKLKKVRRLTNACGSVCTGLVCAINL